MRTLALCAGIGGLEIGLHQAEPTSRVVAWVERDRYCQSILRARMRDGWFEDAPIYDDITTFPADEWVGRVDLISAGFPCQPWSMAGQRKGTTDDRWLWPIIARLMGIIRSRYGFFENVPGLVSGGGFGHVLSDLAALGFDAEWTSLRASDVGAPHQRERIFVLAHARCAERGTDSLCRSDRGERRDGQGQTAGWLTEPGSAMAHAESRREEWATGERPTTRADSGRGSTELVDATGNGWGEGRTASVVDGRRNAVAQPDGAMADACCQFGSGRRIDPCEWHDASQVIANSRRDLSLFPPGPTDADAWRAILAHDPALAPAVATESAIRGVAARTPSRLDEPRATRTNQLRALGNCVVPAQAAYAWRILRDRFNDGEVNR